MIDLDQCTPELLGLAKALRRVPIRCLRDPIALVDWHAGIARQIDQVAKTLTPVAIAEVRRRLPPVQAGSVRDSAGRVVRVERRRRSA